MMAKGWKEPVGKLSARLEGGVKQETSLESLGSYKQHKLDLPQAPWSYLVGPW